MVYLFMLFNVLLMAAVFRCSYSTLFGHYRGCAFNPVFFIGFINVFFIMDFYFLYQEPSIEIFETSFVVLRDDIVWGMFIYSAFNLSFLFACMTSNWLLRNKIRSTESYIVDPVAAVKTFKIVVLMNVALIAVNADLFLAMLVGDTTRQVLFSSNQGLHILFSLIIPSFALYAASKNNDFKSIMVAFLISFMLIFVSGSRGGLILLIIILLIASNKSVRQIRGWYLFAAIPFVATLLLTSRYYLRESWRYSSIGDFINDNGGLGQVFFSTSEISMAEVIVTIDMWKEQIERFPFESFLAAVMYPLPRAIFEFKPFGSGGVLTELLSPMRWEFTRSEIVTTGYGDLLMQFGFVFSIIVFFIISSIWIRSVQNVITGGIQKQILFLPFLIWWPYVFLRADFFNLAGNVWPFVLAMLIYSFFRKMSLGRNTLHMEIKT